MDKEQARLMLGSFRPDGADAGDPYFADALQLALEDRELGEWLANERAFDAVLARGLGSVDVPMTLRSEILACQAGERDDHPRAQDRADAAWIAALAAIQPPDRLREAAIAAMQATAAKQNRKILTFRRTLIPLTAAAGIALAVLVGKPNEAVALTPSPVPVEELHAGFIRTYESPLFRLDEKVADHRVLIKHLEHRALPCPKTLPPGLRNVAGIGCRELVIDGKRGSLVCFDERENGVVHLVIFRREDVCGSLPSCLHPEIVKKGSWATARWADDANVFLLISHTEPDRLAGLF
jgi:hypothetical protein